MSAVVTQADRNAAADLLESGGSKGILCRFDHAMTMRYTDHLDGDSFVQAFARHRTEAAEELVEVLGRLLSLVDRMDVASWLVTEHPAEWANAGDLVSDARTLISKHRGEQG